MDAQRLERTEHSLGRWDPERRSERQTHDRATPEAERDPREDLGGERRSQGDEPDRRDAEEREAPDAHGAKKLRPGDGEGRPGEREAKLREAPVREGMRFHEEPVRMNRTAENRREHGDEN